MADGELQIANRKSQIANRKSQIANRKSQIANRKSQIAHRKSQIANRTSQIAHRKSQIANRTSQIAHRKSQIANRKSQIANRKSQILKTDYRLLITIAFSHHHSTNMNLTPILEQFGLDPLARGLQLIAARELVDDAFPRLDTDRPALVFQLAKTNLKEIARTLRVNYPDVHPLALAQRKRITHFTLGDWKPTGHAARDAVLYLPAVPHPSSPLTLANIMARLRAPVGGCPWDLEQTHASITRALVEETYEVIEAIAENDLAHLQEELGDLFLHVLFQTQIARDQNEFALSDVGAELAAKLIRRHPHVFGDQSASDAAWVLENWEKIKQEEKKKRGIAHNADALDAGIPRHLPALTRAQKIAERARRRKKFAASDALPPALARHLKQKRGAARERAVGELLLGLAAFAEQHDIDAERALHAASKKLAQGNGRQRHKKQE